MQRKPLHNRIDAEMELWNQRQQKYQETFGNDVIRDRDFLKAKQQILRQISKDHSREKLSFDEQISFKILSGQIRQLNRHLYPNPIVRFVRNSSLMIGNILISVTKPLINLTGFFRRTDNNKIEVLTRTPINVNNNVRDQQKENKQNEQSPQLSRKSSQQIRLIHFQHPANKMKIK